jgi:hypothetical protein
MADATFIALAFVRSSGLKYNGLHRYLRRKEQWFMRVLTRSEGVPQRFPSSTKSGEVHPAHLSPSLPTRFT